MSLTKLRRLGFKDEILQYLNKANILTCKDLLSRSQLELLHHVGLGNQTVKETIRRACHEVAPVPTNALQMWKDHKDHSGFFKTSLPGLDKVLHGGIPLGSITEIAGPSGCGKTQFCLLLSTLATLPTQMGGLGGCVLYLDTESTFSAERLVEIAESRHRSYFTEPRLVELTESVYVSQVQTSSELLSRLENLEADIIRLKVKLVVIDSIASLIRKEFDSRVNRSMVDRTKLLLREATILKYLAETFSIPVIVTNQITTYFGTIGQTHETDDVVSLEGSQDYVTAALGNTWSHSVNTRLILQYHRGNQRQLLVAKSPAAPFTVFTYTIQPQGLVQEEFGADHYEGTDPGIQRIKVRSALQIKGLQL
ncbi:DNA repair protein RAD51 homolog 2-like [Liolophura sinensis]|uniref:DNA repair protein RAD51 homolog 2-like n=1 Tax=Liolophura sinensis TaxID=3198878 RepID=UPI003158BC23